MCKAARMVLDPGLHLIARPIRAKITGDSYSIIFEDILAGHSDYSQREDQILGEPRNRSPGEQVLSVRITDNSHEDRRVSFVERQRSRGRKW